MASADATPQRTERVPIMMTKEEVGRLDDWRFRNRIDSRSEAIRQLVKAGLQSADEGGR